MEKRIQGRKVIKMSFIKSFMKGKDIEGDWVTLGVVVNKVPPKTSKNVCFSFNFASNLMYSSKHSTNSFLEPST